MYFTEESMLRIIVGLLFISIGMGIGRTMVQTLFNNYIHDSLERIIELMEERAAASRQDSDEEQEEEEEEQEEEEEEEQEEEEEEKPAEANETVAAEANETVAAEDETEGIEECREAQEDKKLN